MIKKIRIRGKLKGVFFLTRCHWFFPSKFLLFLANLSKLSLWINKHRKIPFSDFYSYSFDYNKRFDLYNYVIRSQNITNRIDYLEFGVSRGHSFKWWIEKIKDPGSRFYGFDTFSGLPEDWGPFKKGDMHNNGEPPRIDDARHTFYQGLFQQTLPEFLSAYNSSNRRIIHMDADLYSSTLFVLTQLTPLLMKGDILFFDEFNVPLHEWKAFSEWTESFYIQYEVLGSVNNFYQVAIILK
jgi:hypothetical protein